MGRHLEFRTDRVTAQISGEFIPVLNVACDWFESYLIESVHLEVLRGLRLSPESDNPWPSGKIPGSGESKMRQGIINLMQVYPYHLFQQQLATLVRAESHYSDETLLEDAEKWQAVFQVFGVDVRFLQSWSKIDELRLIANTVKHPEAGDAEKLFKLRPDLFPDPKFGFQRPKLPLAGEGLFLKPSEFRSSIHGVIEFWTEFLEIVLEKRPKPKTLKDHVHEKREDIIALVQKYGASNVRVFGSVARGEAGPASDVDLLVDFEPGTSFGKEMALIEELQTLLGRKVDLGTFESLKPRLKERAQREAIPL
jgi:uncharacterized protein